MSGRRHRTGDRAVPHRRTEDFPARPHRASPARTGSANRYSSGLLHRAAAGEPIPGITVSPTVVAGYLDQQMSQLPSSDTPLGFVTGQFRFGDQRSVSLLASAGFDVATQRRPIALLSPGQKARLGLLAVRLTEPNCYLMDEPTNHVDIAGQERLEAEILAHEATCMLVSHDRFFVRAIATRMLRIDGGKLREMAVQ